MKIYKTQKEVEADIVDGQLVIDDSVVFECSIKISASISALDILALDISAGNISARNISAGGISFYAFCCAYVKLVCKSIKGRRKNSKYFCLDSEVVIEGDKQ